jgi:hypothetical protein
VLEIFFGTRCGSSEGQAVPGFLLRCSQRWERMVNAAVVLLGAF